MLFGYLLIKDIQVFFMGIKLVFGVFSWAGCFSFILSLLTFDILIVLLLLFKVVFLIVNSIMKRDIEILKKNRKIVLY